MFKRLSYRCAAAATSVLLSASITAPPAGAKVHAPSAPLPTAQLGEPQVFARGSGALFNPDGIVITKRFVFVVYQNQSDHLPGPSTVVKYDRMGRVLASLNLMGRCDGLRLNPATRTLWALLNNDGQNGRPKRAPLLYTIDPVTLAAKRYTFPAVQAHGGGYDDIAFVGGQAFLSASSPTLAPGGINDKPVLVAANLTAAGTVNVTPVLYGNAVGWDANTLSYHALNIADPDTLTVDAVNDLVLVGDNDQEVIVVQYPGSGAQQKIVRYGFGTQFDDVAWSKGSSGTLWIADTTLNVIYTVAAKFPYGTAFAEGPAGIPVQSFIGTFSAGVVTPLLTQRDGIVNPTSLEFVPAQGPTDNI